MHSFRTLLTLALLLSPVFGLPTTTLIQKVAGAKQKNSYIVKLKESADKKATLSWLKGRLGSNSALTYDYDAEFYNGFAGIFSKDVLRALASNMDVESISEDGIVTTQATQTQPKAPWGLERINKPESLKGRDPAQLEYKYVYDDATSGTGVDAYVLDTGIYVLHEEFEGRARWGYTALPIGGDLAASIPLLGPLLPPVGETSVGVDGNGHGTHCAGTIGSRKYGVSKKVSLIAVQVLSAAGSGSVSGIIDGMNWVVKKAKESKRPSIISMSLGGGANQAFDDAVQKVIAAGVHVVVAAGNSNADANGFSPARAPNAITVGASTINDARAAFSNYGVLVDVFAPGQDVISTWIGAPNATNKISGTSMATPHVAGVAAYFLSIEPKLTPAELAEKIRKLSISDALTNMDKSVVGETPNLLLQKNVSI